MIDFEKQLEENAIKSYADIWKMFKNALGDGEGMIFLQHWMQSEGKAIYQDVMTKQSEDAYRFLYFYVTNMLAKNLGVTEDLPITIAKQQWNSVKFGRTNDSSELRATLTDLLNARTKMLLAHQIREGSPRSDREEVWSLM